jgi:hypothetical protein
MEKEEHIYIRGETKELTILRGDALPKREPKIVSIKGTIGAPAEYFRKRPDIEPKKCNVIFSHQETEIILTVNESDYFATTITGKAVLNPELLKFGINTNKTWLKSELKTFLKMNRSFFKTTDEAMQIVSNLEKFSAQIQAKIDDQSDTRGNSKKGAEINVTTDLKMDFTLNIPIYIGQLKSTFKVEICFSVTDGGVTIWLESPEMQEAILNIRGTLIDSNIDCFRKDFVCIER